ncbi:MAG: hypothetical protein ACTSPB_26175, partial [Candidatus Thorarchaeota archaeon]
CRYSMKICVASAHTKCDRSNLWRKLQWKFLSENTKTEFKYYVIANNINPKLFENADGVLHLSQKGNTSFNFSHLTCIQEILGLFAAEKDCTHFLILDSDCWPIRQDWELFLADKLSSRYQFAAPVRTENLDTFPHPSAVFFTREELPDIKIDGNVHINLVGDKVSDVSVTSDGITNNGINCYPLLKTNNCSPHPVYASIYGDIFYHHCAGSRGAGVRCGDYYRHMITDQQQKKIYSKITDLLRKDPTEFINVLRSVDWVDWID